MYSNVKGALSFLLIIVAFQVICSCNKAIPEGKVPGGEVALTFDDSSVDNWYDYLSLLDSLNIKATFYICKYHTLTHQQKDKLHIIAAHGHEIAYHTTHHPDLVNMLKERGLYPIIKEEIEKDLYLMRQDGFQTFNFAYPYGSHISQLDVALLRTFKSIRAVSNPTNCTKSLTKQRGSKQLLYGADIDEVTKFTDDIIIDLLADASTHNDCLILAAHEINTTHKFHISLARLRLLAQEAKNRHITFVTVNQVASKVN